MAISAVERPQERRVRFSPRPDLEKIRYIPSRNELKLQMAESFVSISNPLQETCEVVREFIEKKIAWSRGGRFWASTKHGVAVLERPDIDAIEQYTEFVRKTVKTLEARGIISKKFFQVPRSEILHTDREALYLCQKKVTIIDFHREISGSVEESTEEVQKNKARVIARGLANIIWESGFADAHFGNFFPTASGRWALVDCKPLGLYDSSGVMNEKALPHTGRIGLEKLHNFCQHLGENDYLGFTEMAEELQIFIDQHPLSGESCAVCKKDKEEIDGDASMDIDELNLNLDSL